MLKLTAEPAETLPQFFMLLLVISCSLILGASSEIPPPPPPQPPPQRITAGLLGRTVVRRSENECRPVADYFAGLIKEDELTSSTFSKVNGQSLELCNETTNGTCCTQSVEENLLRLSVNQTKDIIANLSADLKSHLNSDARLYRDHFNELLSLSENNTRDVLTSTFKIPVKSTNSSVEKLFSDFAAYIHLQEPINVRQSVNQFFDALFPSIFTFTIDDPSAITDEYRDCLTNNRKDFTPPPFGEVARKLVQDVAKSLEVARAALDAFDVMVEAISITNRLDYEGYCSGALTRLLFCSKCEGYIEIQPCKNFCLNVVRGCLAHVTDINTHWNLFEAAVEKFFVSLRGSYDFHDVLNSFHSKVYESLMHYLDNAHKYHLPVISKCGYPLAGVTAESLPLDQGIDTSKSAAATTEPNRPLLEKFPKRMLKKFSFNVIVRHIASSKNFFSRLPDAICSSSEQFSSSNNSTCWNGTSIDRYSRPVPVGALTTQVAENPELQVPDALVPEVVRLIEKLNQMTRILHSRVIPLKPSMLADASLEYSGSGFYPDLSSGSGWGPPDDEDGIIDSGSGAVAEPSLKPGIGAAGGEEGVKEEATSVDFEFDRSTSTTIQPSPYQTSSQSSSIIISSATTRRAAMTTTSPSIGVPAGSGSMKTAGFFLPLLALAIQRLYCA